MDFDPAAAAALDPPPIPDDAFSLWAIFMDLHARRRYTDMGTPLGIPYTELHARAAVRRRALEPYQVDAIGRLDLAYLSIRAESAAKATDGR